MSLQEKILNGEEKIALIGLGYVGLPIAVAFSKKAKVIGFDCNASKIELYKNGVDPTKEVGDAALASCSVLFTSDAEKLQEAKFHIVAVPTPVNADHTPDLSLVERASELLGRNLTKGSIVVYESTVYPGVTEDFCVPILERESGLKCGVDFKVGYSPERINPGDKVHRLETITKIVSGMDQESLEEIAGQGIRAVLDGRTILCGNARLMEENGISYDAVQESGTVVLVAVEGSFAGYVLIADTVKADSAGAVEELKAQGLSTAILTGDSAETARAVAAQTGVEAVFAGLLPHQKLERLQQIRKEKGAVLFVGDGINDAPVLAGADVGAAMGSGADAAIEAADVVFMTSEAAAIPAALEIAKKTQTVAWQNVVFALAIKLGVMVLGLFGFASMWLAVFADSGVAMLCVLNSIRMLYSKK